MPAYAAFLRGIMPMNPNMRNEKLRGVFERLGFGDVASIISSGNLVFRSDRTDVATLESEIEEALTAELGITSATLLRDAAELDAMLAANPFGELEHSPETYLTATFVKDRGPLADLPDFATTDGSRVIGSDPVHSAIYLVTDTTAAGTPGVMALLEKKLGKGITTRTWKTVQRVTSKLPRE